MKRRDFIKTAVVATGATVISSEEAHSAGRQSIKVNDNAKAIMPDGSRLSRQEILTKLGLDSSTSPDAWLAVIACGSNASALTQRQLGDAVKIGKIKKGELDVNSLKKLNMGLKIQNKLNIK